MEKQEFSEDLKKLIGFIQFMGEGGSFTEMDDFLIHSFTKMVGSDWYIDLDAKQRENLFEQYHELQYVLNNLEQFVEKYPETSATTVEGNYHEKELQKCG